MERTRGGAGAELREEVVETGMALGKSLGRSEAVIEASDEVLAQIPIISRLASNPEESLKISAALVDLAIKILAIKSIK